MLESVYATLKMLLSSIFFWKTVLPTIL